MFKKVTPSLFTSTIARAGISKQLKAQAGLVVAEAVLKERFGEGAHIHAIPKYIRHRVLTIAIAHPAVGEQIRLEEESIIREMNRRLGKDDVLRIQFSLEQKSEQDTMSE